MIETEIKIEQAQVAFVRFVDDYCADFANTEKSCDFRAENFCNKFFSQLNFDEEDDYQLFRCSACVEKFGKGEK